MRFVSFSWHLFLWSGALSAMVLSQNITIQPADQSIQYLPANAWSFSSRPGAINGSFAHAVAENATAIFHITVPATTIFWRGYLPSTPAQYSICIDCAREDEVGHIVALDATAPNASSGPIILFTSALLDNTTHTIILRNIRNSIEAVVGEMSVDAFIFTADIPTIAPSPVCSPNDKKLVIAIASIAVLIAFVVGSLIEMRYQCFRRIGSSSRYSPKRPLLLGSGDWKRWKRKEDVESVSMTQTDRKTRPFMLGNIQVSIRKQKNQKGKTTEKGNETAGPHDVVVPYITVTSPTIPTSSSMYSTTHDAPLPPRPISDNGNRNTIARQSDPFLHYAAAYAAFSGIEDPHSPVCLNSARRESATLPPSGLQGRDDNGSQAPEHDSLSYPPSSFNGHGIRSGTKRERTLSDKIKRGTLPPPPVASIVSKKIETQEAAGSPGSGILASKQDTQVPAAEVSVALAQPSFLPSVSSKSPPSSISAKNCQSGSPRQPSDAPSSIKMSPGRSSQQMATFDDESEFWQTHGSLPLGVAFVESGVVLSLGSDQSTKEPSPSHINNPVLEGIVSQPDNQAISEGGENNSSGRNGVNTASMITNKTFNTTGSRTSFTPSVSEFPVPPFNEMTNNSYSNANEDDTAMDDSSPNIRPPSFVPNIIRTISSSSNTLESGSSVKSLQDASPLPWHAYRQRRPRVPHVKNVQLGLGAPISVQTTGRRRGSGGVRNGLSRSSSRLKLSGIAKVPGKGEVLPPVQQRSQDVEVEDSSLSLATSESGEMPKGTVPFYMANRMSEGDRGTSDTELKGSSDFLNSSRLTFGSTLTTTDEEYASGVQVVVVTRGIPPDLPRAIKQSPSPIEIDPTTSPDSDGVVSKSSDDSRWDTVQPRPGPSPCLTPISIARVDEVYRPNGPTANVPVSAIADGFDGRSVDSHARASRLDLATSQGLNTGSGMPWSPNFIWPSSPPFNFTGPIPSTFNTFQPESPSQTLREVGRRTGQEPVNRTDYPNLVANLVTDLSGVSASKVGVNVASTSSRQELGWKDGVATNLIQTRSRSKSRLNFASRLSTYSTASSFFGGGQASSEPPLFFPLDTPLPKTPSTSFSPDILGQFTYFNARGWQSRPASSQSPVSPNPHSPRHTASTPLNVNSVFSTSGSSISRPLSGLRKPLAQDGRLLIPTPRRERTHGYPSPVSIPPSPPEFKW